jgi:acyl-CoA thioester hydrolase
VINSTTTINVRYGETDGMAIAYHPNYFTWFEVGRVQLLKDIGLDYKTIEAEGFKLPVLEAYAKFMRSTYFDDVLTLKTSIATPPSARLRMTYTLLKGDVPVTTGYTIHAFINTLGIAVKPPELFWNVVMRHF